MNYVLPTDKKFLCQQRNGDTFATNPTTDYVSYFQGLIFEKMKLVATYDVSTVTLASAEAPIVFEDLGSEIKITHPYNSWSNEGFVVGNTIAVRDLNTGKNTTETVNNIAGQEMYISDTSFMSTMVWTSGNSQEYAKLSVTTVPTSLIFKFGLKPFPTFSESVVGPYASLLDGQIQAYSTNGVSGSLTDLDYLSSNSSNLGSVQAKYDGASGTDSEVFSFTVEHIFRVPHFIAAWLTNYLNGTIPNPFTGTNSLKWLAELNFGVNVNNPNDGKIFVDDYLSGSCGFLGQNFNAGSSVYSLETAAAYSISGDEVIAPEVTASTLVTAQIKKNNGNFTAGVKCYLYISKLPSENQYSDNTDSYEDNFVFEQLSNTDGSGATSNLGGAIKTYTCNINGSDASLVDIQFTLTFPSSMQSNLQAGDQFSMVVITEDSALSATLSDRTPIELDTAELTKDGDVSGQITNFQGDLKIRGASTAFTRTSNWINQIYEYDFSFDLTKAANSSDALVTKCELQLISFNTSTDDHFIVDSYQFPFYLKIPTVDVDGTDYQLFNVDATRFLSVPDTDPAREVQLTSSAPGSYSATQGFTGKVGFITSWQEWKENTNVPNIFYNGSLPNEFYNKNKKADNYSGVNSYDIYVALIVTVLADGVETDYACISDKCVIFDLDEDGTGNGWSAVTKIYDKNDEETDNIYNQNCRVEVEFSQATAGSLTLADVIGQIAIEETANTGRHWRLHTGVDWSETNNPLEPLVGETYVKKTQDVPGNTITLECLLDGTKLDPSKTYRIYAHLNDGR